MACDSGRYASVALGFSQRKPLSDLRVGGEALNDLIRQPMKES
jgi:hypothetical protein